MAGRKKVGVKVKVTRPYLVFIRSNLPVSVFYESTSYNSCGIGCLEFTLVDQTIGRFVRLDNLFV